MLKSNRRLGYQELESRRLLATVCLPSDLAGEPTQVVAVPVSIDNAAGVRAAEIRIQYDTTALDLDSSSVALGSVWRESTDAQITANVDDATGTIVLFVSSSSNLPTGAGSLAVLSFSVSSTATVGSTAALDLSTAVLNEGGIPVTPAPIAGTDATDGLITIVAQTAGDDRIAGVVYADANNNNTLDSSEAIPGVTLTLRNVASGNEQQITTEADGSYEFDDLTPGTYQILQQQPVAYIDGGSNTLSVTLVADQALVDQNFREVGLLPQFIYNRLLTTTVQPAGSVTWSSQIEKINEDARAGTVAPPTAVASTASSSVIATATDVARTPFNAGDSATEETIIQEMTADAGPVATLEPLWETPSVANAVVVENRKSQDSLDSDDDRPWYELVDQTLATTIF